VHAVAARDSGYVEGCWIDPQGNAATPAARHAVAWWTCSSKDHLESFADGLTQAQEKPALEGAGFFFTAGW
jgi:hypothetical protein